MVYLPVQLWGMGHWPLLLLNTSILSRHSSLLRAQCAPNPALPERSALKYGGFLAKFYPDLKQLFRAVIEVHTDPRRFLGKIVNVRIDRPIGSKHESFDIHYPVNYGYVPGTVAPDGEELDAYVLGVSVPIKEFTGTCIALIRRTNDNEDKLVVAPENAEFSDEQIRAMTRFQEVYFESVITRQ